MLEHKNVVIYGAGGAVGAAIARKFAAEGATVYLTGRTLDKVEAVAAEIRHSGGRAEAAQVDALNEDAVEAYVNALIQRVGSIDISFNAISISQDGLQGTPLLKLSAEKFNLPMMTYPLSQFLTARAAGRQMRKQQSGVILLNTATPARSGIPLVGGMSAAWAAVESLSKSLSVELGQFGIRVVCLRTGPMPETQQVQEVFRSLAETTQMTPEQFQADIEQTTHSRQLISLDEFTNVAAFVCSDQAGPLTGTIINLSSGSVAD